MQPNYLNMLSIDSEQVINDLANALYSLMYDDAIQQPNVVIENRKDKLRSTSRNLYHVIRGTLRYRDPDVANAFIQVLTDIQKDVDKRNNLDKRVVNLLAQLTVLSLKAYQSVKVLMMTFHDIDGFDTAIPNINKVMAIGKIGDKRLDERAFYISSSDGIFKMYRVTKYEVKKKTGYFIAYLPEEAHSDIATLDINDKPDKTYYSLEYVKDGLKMLCILNDTEYRFDKINNVKLYSRPGGPLVMIYNEYFAAIAPKINVDEDEVEKDDSSNTGGDANADKPN